MANVLGIDPGTTKAGWAIWNTNVELLIDQGHSDWDEVRRMLKDPLLNIEKCAMEDIIIYSGTPGSQRNMPIMIEQMGRIIQVCEDNNIVWTKKSRIDVIEALTGARPKRGKPVSKGEMQKCVQELLDLDKRVSPQHANDALCVILSVYPPK